MGNTINIAPTGPTLEIREGKALPLEHSKPLNITGRLSAPGDFLQNKISNYDPSSCYVEIRETDQSITLILNEKDPFSKDTIVGELKSAPELEAWHINTSEMFHVSELLKFFKLHRFEFADMAAHAKLIEGFQSWGAKIETVIKDHNDNAGSSLLHLEQKVNADAKDFNRKFLVDLPIFKGYPAQRFEVEIGFMPANRVVMMYLISDLLPEVTQAYRKKLFQEEKDRIASLGFNCSIVHIN